MYQLGIHIYVYNYIMLHINKHIKLREFECSMGP